MLWGAGFVMMDRCRHDRDQIGICGKLGIRCSVRFRARGPRRFRLGTRHDGMRLMNDSDQQQQKEEHDAHADAHELDARKQ